MKKALKIIAGVIGFLILAAAVAFFVLVSKLPSAWDIKKATTPRAAQSPEFNAETTTTTSSVKDLPAKPTATPPPVRTDEDRADEGKELSQRALREDLLNDRQPLASSCANLNHASSSHLMRNDESANSKEFLKSLTSEEKDPMVESSASVLRYTLRLSSVRDLLETVDRAQQEGASDLLTKASFYSKVALAANQIRIHKPQIDQLLMKSYNLYTLSQVVAKNPQMANDPSTLQFCEQIEKNINMNMDFDPNLQSQEMLKFLEYAKVNPQDIDYDPNYRSDVKFNFTNNQLSMNNIWIEKLFASDIKKAKDHIGSPSPSTNQ